MPSAFPIKLFRILILYFVCSVVVLRSHIAQADLELAVQLRLSFGILILLLPISQVLGLQASAIIPGFTEHCRLNPRLLVY